MFDLDKAVEAIQEADRQAAAAREREKRAESTQDVAGHCFKLLEVLSRFVPTDVQETLLVRALPDPRAMHGARIAFEVDGEEWALLLDLVGKGGCLWYVVPPEGFVSDTEFTVQGPDLLAELLRAIGRRRAVVAQRKTIQQMRDRCQAKLDSALAEADREAWAWPEGATVKLYEWAWCVAAGEDDAEYQIGWSTADRLSSDGYVDLYEEFNAATKRALRLDMHAHKPVVRVNVYSSTADLPRALTESVVVEVEGLAWADHAFDVLCEEAGAVLQETLPRRIPIAWVRALIDS